MEIGVAVGALCQPSSVRVLAEARSTSKSRINCFSVQRGRDCVSDSQQLPDCSREGAATRLRGQASQQAKWLSQQRSSCAKGLHSAEEEPVVVVADAVKPPHVSMSSRSSGLGSDGAERN